MIREGPATDGPCWGLGLWLAVFDLASELDLGVMVIGLIGDGVDPDLARLTGDRDTSEDGESVR